MATEESARQFNPGDKEILTAEELCLALDIPRSTLDLFRDSERIPHVKLGKRSYYLWRTSILPWLKERQDRQMESR